MEGLRPHLKQQLGLVIMAKPFVNFLSYNSTGIDSVKTDWIRTLMKTCDISFLQLQEHFKAAKSTDKYFKKEFQGNNSYVIPAHRESGQDNGRAKGGLAQISDKKILTSAKGYLRYPLHE